MSSTATNTCIYLRYISVRSVIHAPLSTTSKYLAAKNDFGIGNSCALISCQLRRSVSQRGARQRPRRIWNQNHPDDARKLTICFSALLSCLMIQLRLLPVLEWRPSAVVSSIHLKRCSCKWIFDESDKATCQHGGKMQRLHQSPTQAIYSHQPRVLKLSSDGNCESDVTRLKGFSRIMLGLLTVRMSFNDFLQ